MKGLRVGLATPIVTAVPGAHADWERAGSVEDLVQVVRAADEAGLDHVTCSEHAVVPTDVAAQRGGTYWDPAATLAYLAAVTTQVRLVTHVLVLGYTHPLVLAKRYATLDRLSGGRVVLGVGVGSLEEEFRLLGVPFEGRGERADDALRALRAALASGGPTYAGPHYAFDDVVLDPAPVQAQIPFWTGGRTARSLRRALELGQGWTPFGLRLSEVGDLLAAQALPAGFEVVLGSGPLDPLGDADGTRTRLDRLQQAGATRVTASLTSTSADHLVEQVGALGRLVA